MISVGKLGSASDAASYYARDNYYTADQSEGISAWAGEGAAELGLTGPVDARQFEKVLAGELPNGVVLDAARGEHRAGWDVTMSVPKSVSILALVGGDERLIDAVRASAANTLKWMEANLAQGRIWNGVTQVPQHSGKFVAATFLHDVNRAGEPQSHIHAVIANATRTADGKWRALDPYQLYKHQHATDAVFLADLRARIETLGYATVPRHDLRNGSFEIAGVSREVVELFSTRSAQINAYLREHKLESTARSRELAALATRDPKAPDPAPEQRAERWRALAAERGLDPAALVSKALAAAGKGETVWSRAMTGARSVGAKGLAVLAQMGLTPRDGDRLVPERLGRLRPTQFAAAQAVASAVRELGEREAAFGRLELIRTALERGGPVTVGDIEARIALLESRRLLIPGDTRLLTTEMAQRAEAQVLGLMTTGKGQVAPVLSRESAPPQVQQAAGELGLRRLTPAQESAATLILASSDRIVLIQGVSGAGKSAVLAPVTKIAEREGRGVLGLAVAGTIAAQLRRDLQAPARTIASFLEQHRTILDGSASPERMIEAREALGGALLLVDEASQIGTAQMSELLRVAERLGVGRVALVGDKRQTGAVEAGKPFAQAQSHGIVTAELSENLRARSPTMKEAAAALNAGDVARAFQALRPVTTEVPRVHMPAVAANLWATLPKEERDRTLLITSGRAMRSEANAAAQAEMKATGEIGGRAVVLQVLDRVTSTREGARQERAYRPDHIVEFRTDLPSQQLRRGDRGTVVSVDRGQVVLRMTDGRHRLFVPGQLRRDLRQDAVTVHVRKEVALHAGDRIRWTDNDHGRELLNQQLARVEKIGRNTITVSSLVDGTVHELARGDRMLEKLDLAYAINVHTAQGVTTDHGIVLMSERDRQLASQATFLVAVTRIADNATLVVDSGQGLERAVQRNLGEKTSALDVSAAMPRASPTSEVARHPVSPGERIASDPSLDLRAIRVQVEPKVPDFPFPEKDIGLEL